MKYKTRKISKKSLPKSLRRVRRKSDGKAVWLVGSQEFATLRDVKNFYRKEK